MELRQYQREDIAGLFGVPPHKIGDLSRSTNNNIEHQDLEWHRDGVTTPWCVRGQRGVASLPPSTVELD